MILLAQRDFERCITSEEILHALSKNADNIDQTKIGVLNTACKCFHFYVTKCNPGPVLKEIVFRLANLEKYKSILISV